MPAEVKKSRSRRSKAEVQQEFQTIVEEAKEAQEEKSSKSEVALQLAETKIKEAVSCLTVELLSKKIADLKSEINNSLANISEKMESEVTLLTTLRQAVELESKELAKLHNLDISATSIDQLILDYNTKKEQFEAEMKLIKDQWEEDQAVKEKREREEEELLQKNRQREIEDYKYKTALERKKLQDKYEEELYLKQKQNKENQESLEKNWQTREDFLKQKEDDFNRLKKEVEEFPAKLIKENNKAAEEATKHAEMKFSQEIHNLKHELAVEKQISDLKIKGLQETITTLQAQIKTLQSQLDEAKKQVQDIAVKAIEGASGAKALSHINQIAIEQAKNRNNPA